MLGSLDLNHGCKLGIDIISSVLDGYYTTALAMADNRNGLTTVTAEGKKESLELLVTGVDALYDIFYSFFSVA